MFYQLTTQLTGIPVSGQPLTVKRRFRRTRQTVTLKRVENRDLDIEIAELEHLEIELSKDRAVLAGYVIAGDRLRPRDLSGIIAWFSLNKARTADCERRI